MPSNLHSSPVTCHLIPEGKLMGLFLKTDQTLCFVSMFLLPVGTEALSWVTSTASSCVKKNSQLSWIFSLYVSRSVLKLLLFIRHPGETLLWNTLSPLMQNTLNQKDKVFPVKFFDHGYHSGVLACRTDNCNMRSYSLSKPPLLWSLEFIQSRTKVLSWDAVELYCMWKVVKQRPAGFDQL